MKNQIIFLIMGFAISGCSLNNSSSIGIDDSDNNGLGGGFACTLKGSSNLIEIRIDSETPLPENFAVAFNGENIHVDECDNDEFIYDKNIEFNAERTQASIILNFDGDQKLREKYLPDLSKPPQSDTINVNIYERSNCSEVPKKILSVEDAKLSWSPIYINGEDCGITSYAAQSQLNLGQKLIGSK